MLHEVKEILTHRSDSLRIWSDTPIEHLEQT